MGSAVVWRTAGGGAVRGKPVGRGVCGVAEARGSDGGESDALEFRAANGGGGQGRCGEGEERKERREKRKERTESAGGDIRGRGIRSGEAEEVGGEVWREDEAGEHVRNHGDHRACDLLGGKEGGDQGKEWRKSD